MCASTTTAHGDFVNKIKLQEAQDKGYQKLLEEVRLGVCKRYWLHTDGTLHSKGGRTYIPSGGGLRKEVMRECHDSRWAGHPGVERMFALMSRSYYWPKMEDDVEAFVKTCLVCQQDKVERRKEAGLLQPLPVPARPWTSVSMDFITGFPKIGDYSSVFVIVDRFSKFAVLIPVSATCTAEKAAEEFFSHVVRYFGLPEEIISDRDSRFTGRFWTTLFEAMGSKLRFSTANHPQTDGQTERINALVEEYLRHFVTASQKNWVELLDAAQFCYNLHRSSATEKSPFELVYGRQPLTPQETARATASERCPAAAKFIHSRQETLDEARDSLEKARRRMKKYADQHRRAVEYQVGDKVMLKVGQQLRKKLRGTGVHKGLVQQFEGPFEVIKRVGQVAYTLQLPRRLNLHPTFHVSFLKPFYTDSDPTRQQVQRPPPTTTSYFEREIEKILQKRVRGGNRTDFLVHWRGTPESEASWEEAETLWQFERQVEDFLSSTGRPTRKSTRASTSLGGGGL